MSPPATPTRKTSSGSCGSDVQTVWKALDLEGEKRVEEEIGIVGARHRAAYRIAAALPGSLAIVISQDGGVRFVSQMDGRVTYWEHD
jgi:DNA integrity scanning protein DisA with diadenylate cyclase activity